jgi:hypothetical protein
VLFSNSRVGDSEKNGQDQHKPYDFQRSFNGEIKEVTGKDIHGDDDHHHGQEEDTDGIDRPGDRKAYAFQITDNSVKPHHIFLISGLYLFLITGLIRTFFQENHISVCLLTRPAYT